jgi:hypothetical protein
MTNSWVDIKNANLVLIMGGNAAEAHPCGFKWVTEAKAHNKAKLVVVDPRFTRSAAVADYYAPIRAGSDIAFLGGVINYLIGHDKISTSTSRRIPTRPSSCKDYAFTDGIFSGYDSKTKKYDRASWMYELGKDGYVKSDTTLQHPRCVFNLMRCTTRAHPTGQQDHGHTARPVPEDLRDDRGDFSAQPGDDNPLCPGLDAALASSQMTAARRWCSCCSAMSVCRGAE